MKKQCRYCKKSFYGRKDKKYCSIACKNEYHSRLRKATNIATRATDNILHRNRSILLEIMGKRLTKKKIAKEELVKRHFKFEYITGYYENAQQKRYHIVYDFAWMEFSNGLVLIIRRD